MGKHYAQNEYYYYSYMKKIAIVILNYNSSTDCQKCVEFLKRQQDIELEIIIVDNCSQNNDSEKVKTLCEDQGCTFILATENKGYNAGNNIGLRYAVAKGYKYALIANPDMEFPQTDYVEKLTITMENLPDVVVCGSNILGVNNCHQNPWKFSSFWDDLFPFMNLLSRDKRMLPLRSSYCDILTGCCIMVRLDFIVSLGYFDENVFLYSEEAILGKQVRQYGRKMYYLNNATAIHRHIDSAKGSFKKRHELFWKSRWYYLKKYSGYNKFLLSMIYLSRKVYYGVKMVYFKLKGIV